MNCLIVNKWRLDNSKISQKTKQIWKFIIKRLGEGQWFCSKEVYSSFNDLLIRSDVTRVFNQLENKYKVIRREQPRVRVINRQHLHQLIELVPIKNIHSLAFIIESIFISNNHENNEKDITLALFAIEQFNYTDSHPKFYNQMTLLMQHHSIRTFMN